MGSSILNAVSVGSMKKLGNGLLLFGLCVAGFVMFDTFGIYWQSVTIHGILNRMRSIMYEKVLHARYDAVNKPGQGEDLLFKLNSDVNMINSVLSYGLLSPVMSFISGMGATVVLIRINVWVCLGIYAFGLLYLLYQTAMIRKESAIRRESQKNTSESMTLLLENHVNGIAVRLCNLTEGREKKVSEKLGVLEGVLRKNAWLQVRQGIGQGAIGHLQSVGMLIAGIWLYRNGRIIMGDIIILYQMAALIVNMITSVTGVYSSLRNAYVGFSRCRNTILLPGEEYGQPEEGQGRFEERCGKPGEECELIEEGSGRPGEECELIEKGRGEPEKKGELIEKGRREPEKKGELIEKGRGEPEKKGELIEKGRGVPEKKNELIEECGRLPEKERGLPKGESCLSEGQAEFAMTVLMADRSAPEGIAVEGLSCTLNDYTVFENLDLHTKNRGFYMLAGESGKGKTTFFRILVGLYPYQAGKLRLYGKEREAYSLRSLREQITYCTQENAIFHGTLRENLVWRSSGVTDVRIWEVLGSLALEEWILHLEHGLDTPVSNGGLEFSGGQRKGLLIARALLEDRPVLLLDEVFAGVDQRHMDIWMEVLKKRAERSLILMISHEEGLKEAMS